MAPLSSSTCRSRLLLAGSVLVAATAAGAAQPPRLDFELVAHGTPRLVEAGGELQVELTLRNTGARPWDPASDDRLAYHWLAPDRSVVVLNGARTDLPGRVEPGEEVSLRATLEGPPAKGRYLLQWNMVREHVTWYAAASDPRRETVEVEALPAALAWEAVGFEPPRLLWRDDITRIPFVVRNTGRVAWSPATRDRLSYHVRDRRGEIVQWDGLRTDLPGTVAPGEAVALQALARGPARSGLLTVEWEMLREGERWYGPPAGGEPPTTRVLVLPKLGTLLVVLLAATGMAVVGLRRRAGALPEWLLRGVPLLWAWAALSILAVAFNHLELEVWGGQTLVALGTGALLAAPLALVPLRWQGWAACAWVGALALLVFADLVHFRAFESTVPLTALWSAHQLQHVDQSVAVLSRGWDLWLALAPLAGLVLALGWRPPRQPSTATSGSPWRRWRGPLLAFLAALVLALPALVELRRTLHMEGIAERVFSERWVVHRFGGLHTHLFNAVRQAREGLAARHLDEAQRRRIEELFGARADARPAEGPLFGVARGANVLVIQLESVDAWPIGLEVSDQRVTPFLDVLRQHALFYPNFFDQTHQGRTSDAELLVLNSLHPLDRGAVVFRRPGNRFVALPEVLARHGYATLSAHAYQRGFWNRVRIHPRYGFERSLFAREIGPPGLGEHIGWGLADGPFFERMVPVLEQLEEPFFAFLITLSVHHPYQDVPIELRRLALGSVDRHLVWDYLHSLHYLDGVLQEFFLELLDRRLLDDTVVAVYGDHDSGVTLEPAALELADADPLDPTLRVTMDRVPLYVLLPGREPAGDVTTIGGHLDVAPTLLHLLGLEAPRSFLGRPLLPGGDGVAVRPDGSVVTEDRLYLREAGPAAPDGACFTHPRPAPLPLAACDDLARLGRDELGAARRVLLHDLAAEIAGWQR